MSILQQSAAFAREKKRDGGGDEKQGDDDDEDDEDSAAAGAAGAFDWAVAFESRDRAGTGRTTADGLKGVLKEVSPQNSSCRVGEGQGGGASVGMTREHSNQDQV